MLSLVLNFSVDTKFLLKIEKQLDFQTFEVFLEMVVKKNKTYFQILLKLRFLSLGCCSEIVKMNQILYQDSIGNYNH